MVAGRSPQWRVVRVVWLGARVPTTHLCGLFSFLSTLFLFPIPLLLYSLSLFLLQSSEFSVFGLLVVVEVSGSLCVFGVSGFETDSDRGKRVAYMFRE